MENKILWIDNDNEPIGTSDGLEVVWLRTLTEFKSYLNKSVPYPRFISIGENVGDDSTCIDVVEVLMKDVRNYNTKTLPDISIHFDNEEYKEEISKLVKRYKRL